MALINTAGILAGQRGFRVLVLDLDLEAPGLSYLDPELPDVSPAQAQRQLPLQPGFVDLLSDVKEHGQDADLFALPAAEIEARYTQKIRLPSDLRQFADGSLRIMPAGLFDDKYAERLDALNLNALYHDGLGEPLIRAFKKKIAEAGLYDYVLVDSRTGMSEGAGICTRDLADHVMILSGLNRQNVQGTCEFLREFRAATGGKRSFQVILSPMPNGEDKLVDDRRAAAESAFEQAWGAKVDLSLEIPYHPQLALTEEPHIFRRRRGYLFEAYRAIEGSMLGALGHDAWTLRWRVMKSLQARSYGPALDGLRYMVRLDEGSAVLSGLAQQIVRPPGTQRKLETSSPEDPVAIGALLGDEAGRRVVEFIVENLPLDREDWLVRRWVHELEQGYPGLADRLFERMLHSAQEHASALGRLAASFETDGNLDRAEVLYRRATDASPGDAASLGHYALFLLRRRHDLGAADSFFMRAIEAGPGHVPSLCNYGQALAGQGRLKEAGEKLLAAFGALREFEYAWVAELCFALWLVRRMQGQEAQRWEGCFKLAVQRGFKRSAWDFDRMLERAGKALAPEELEYAKALAAAFLDESKVAALDQYERWRNLEPLDPRSLVGHRAS
jgi:tetratricopeptide (TPR) repeat protein